MKGATGGCYLRGRGRGAEQDLIPYVGQLELANVPVTGWSIDHYVNGLLYGPSVMHLPIHYEEIVPTDVMTRDVAMVRREGALRFSLSFSPKGLADFPMYSSSQSCLLHLYL